MEESGQEGRYPEQDAGKKKGRKKWIIAIVCILTVLGLIAGAGYAEFHRYFSLMGRLGSLEPFETAGVSDQSGEEPGTEPETEPDTEPEELPSVPPAAEDEIDRIEEELQKNLEEMESASELYATDAFNLLLIGVDSRSDSMTGRSDSMILVSINKKTKQAVMTSILRDIYLSIPGYGNNRLNAAYAFGGTDLLAETIRANFGITVDRCVAVNFFLVMDLVNAVGGVDLEVTAEEIDVMNGYIRHHNQLLGNPKDTDILSAEDAGTIHADGNQALAYARVRYVGTDFARTGRQRTVITKCLEKIKQMKLREISGLAEEFLPRVHTDLSEGDCAALLMMALNLGDYELDNMTIPMDGTWNYANIREMSVLTIDFSANARAWRDKVEGSGE